MHIPTCFFGIKTGTRSIHALEPSKAVPVVLLFLNFALLDQTLLLAVLLFSCKAFLLCLTVIIRLFLRFDSALFFFLVALLVNLALVVVLRDKCFLLLITAPVREHGVDDPNDTDTQTDNAPNVQLHILPFRLRVRILSV